MKIIYHRIFGVDFRYVFFKLFVITEIIDLGTIICYFFLEGIETIFLFFIYIYIYFIDFGLDIPS